MGSEPDADPRSTPKLSLYSLPPKSSEPAGMLTPPLRPPASVPFVWEEAPGKPRTRDFKPARARSLELPPRLLSEIKITNLPSPNTVLDGPYVARSVSCSSFRDLGQRSLKASVTPTTSSSSPEKWYLGSGSSGGWPPQKKEKQCLVRFWGKRAGKGKKGNGRVEATSTTNNGEGALGFSSSASFMSSRDREGCGDDQAKVKITRFRRNHSLMNLSNTSTHFWASIYGSLKHVVPWRVRKLKKDGLL